MAIQSVTAMPGQGQSAPLGRAKWALCPSCGRVARFKFVGIQNGGRAPVVLRLWVCSACGSARAQSSLMKPVMV